MKYIKLLIIISLIASCKSQTNFQLIKGTWTEPKPKDSIKRELIFADKELLIYKFPPKKNDSIKYQLTDNEKRLKTIERSGQEYDIEIYRLTKTELVLVRGKDTLRLIRE